MESGNYVTTRGRTGLETTLKKAWAKRNLVSDPCSWRIGGGTVCSGTRRLCGDFADEASERFLFRRSTLGLTLGEFGRDRAGIAGEKQFDEEL